MSIFIKTLRQRHRDVRQNSEKLTGKVQSMCDVQTEHGRLGKISETTIAVQVTTRKQTRVNATAWR